jgi:hypothetical protein
MVIRRRVYLMASLYLIALGGFLAGLAVFQELPKGVALTGGALLALSVMAFAGALVGLWRAFKP